MGVAAEMAAIVSDKLMGQLGVYRWRDVFFFFFFFFKFILFRSKVEKERSEAGLKKYPEITHLTAAF
jgi:hypothetical protein